VRDSQGPLRDQERPSFGELTKIEIRPDLERNEIAGGASQSWPTPFRGFVSWVGSIPADAVDIPRLRMRLSICPTGRLRWG
jgi:hypothetical protein